VSDAQLRRAAAWILAINIATPAFCFAIGWRELGMFIFAFASSVAMSFPAILLGTRLTATEGQPVMVAALVAFGGSMLIWTIAACVVLLTFAISHRGG